MTCLSLRVSCVHVWVSAVFKHCLLSSLECIGLCMNTYQAACMNHSDVTFALDVAIAISKCACPVQCLTHNDVVIVNLLRFHS